MAPPIAVAVAAIYDFESENLWKYYVLCNAMLCVVCISI